MLTSSLLATGSVSALSTHKVETMAIPLPSITILEHCLGGKLTLLLLHNATNHKPDMGEECGKQTIMRTHHIETLTKGSTMVLHRHATIKIISNNDTYIAQRKTEPRCLLHDADTPVYIRRITITKVVRYAFCQVRAGIKRLMTHQHAP